MVSLERKLQDSRKENLNLQNRFDQLQNRFEQLSKRQLSSPMLGRAKHLRNSWAETNVDDAILTATSTNQMKTEEQTPAGVCVSVCVCGGLCECVCVCACVCVCVCVVRVCE